MSFNLSPWCLTDIKPPQNVSPLLCPQIGHNASVYRQIYSLWGFWNQIFWMGGWLALFSTCVLWGRVWFLSRFSFSQTTMCLHAKFQLPRFEIMSFSSSGLYSKSEGDSWNVFGHIMKKEDLTSKSKWTEERSGPPDKLTWLDSRTVHYIGNRCSF